ncbi:MAG: excisionase family DNA-binding protein [Thermoanaerobaculaceae bacterium]|jgi:excisionase family DNA binding protein|nr:excisionase family DNA-binding protein [Thermoanaerobaculaceae bacterium]
MHDTPDAPGEPLDWLTVRDLADRLQVRIGHLRALVARHQIPFVKVGRLVRFHWPTVQRWAERNAEAVGAQTREAAARGARP